MNKKILNRKLYAHFFMALIFSFVVIMFLDIDIALADPELPGDGDGDGDGDNEDNEPKSLSDQICKIRTIFCGNAANAIISAAIFVVGILFFTGKMTWQTAVIVSVGIVIFNNADFLALALAPGNAVLGAIVGGSQGESPFNIKCVCLTNVEFWKDIYEDIKNALTGGGG
jgi:type IV secretory pathway VirB2 component (pilin)